MATVVAQNQKSVQQDFVLVGPHVGKTMAVNGHPFQDGRYRFTGPGHQVESLTKIFATYSALPIEQAEAYQIQYILANSDDEEMKAKAAERLAQLQGQSEEERQAAEEAARQAADRADAVAADLKRQADEDQAAREASAKALAAALGEGGSEDGGNPDGNSDNSNADGAAVKLTLGEAIGQLDPEADTHWTSNNLPSLDILSELIGKKVGRADVEAVAEGYTRAKARAAKQ